MTNELDQINIEYQALQQKRELLLKEKEENKVTEFLKLEWTKHCYASLTICPYGGVGLPTYILKIGALKIDTIPEFDCYSNRYLNIMGNDKDYQQNITYHQNRTQSDFPTFETSNHEMMAKFIKTVEFKEIRYNEKDLVVLLAAKEVNERPI